MAVPTTRLRLRVAPGARSSEIVGRHGEGWKVRVAARPERGRANEAVIRLLAERLEVDRSQLTLVSGAAAKDKVVELRGLSAELAERRLARAGA
jgi:uncharacterized protein YggU (UPF0235/DUF167 family)